MAPVMPSPGARPRWVRLAVPLVLVAGIVIAGSPAHACSCLQPDLATWLTEADGAFVGRWIDRAEVGGGMAAVTFEVERVVKGSFGPKAIVRTNAQGSACGMEQLGPSRTGLLLQRGPDGVWGSDLCSMVPAAQLLAMGEGHPPDPEIASVSAGWSSLWVGVSVLAAALALFALAMVVRRGRSRPEESGVA